MVSGETRVCGEVFGDDLGKERERENAIRSGMESVGLEQRTDKSGIYMSDTT